MTTNQWKSVPGELLPRWYAVFGASRNGADVAGACPVCEEPQLHRYYQVGRPVDRESGGERFVATGASWEWCSNCRTFVHASALVPDWWPADLVVDARQLTALPDALDEAVRRRPHAAAAVRKVSVVELRAFDGQREEVVARLVLTPAGKVVTVAPSANHAKLADDDVARLPGPQGTWVTREAGRAFLELLAPNFRGSRYFATQVFEMDEDAAMTLTAGDPVVTR